MKASMEGGMNRTDRQSLLTEDGMANALDSSEFLVNMLYSNSGGNELRSNIDRNRVRWALRLKVGMKMSIQLPAVLETCQQHILYLMKDLYNSVKKTSK